MKRVFVFCVMLFFLSGQAIRSQIPETISYQGILTNADKTFVADGPYKLTFSLYDGETAVAALWTETHNSVPVIRGIFNVILGSLNPLTPAQLAFDKQYWLGVTVGTGNELTPRIKLSSVAYSLNARSVADGSVTTEKLADNAVTTAKIQPDIVSSVDGVTNDGGNVDLISQNAITIKPDNTTNVITIGESHSARTDNPHNTTAAQTGALMSVDGVNNAGGNVDLIPQNAIIINPSNAANTITIGENHSSETDNPHSVTASQVGAWSLTGNSGTSNNFLGTTDNEPLEFRVNNIPFFRLEPHENIPNIIGGFSGNNAIPDTYGGCTISGGGRTYNINSVSGYGAVGGGYGNKAYDYCGTVGGGANNTTNSSYASVCGGAANTASGIGSTIPGGVSNKAIGNYSFAVGKYARANHDGAFVFSSSTTDDSSNTFDSIRDNEFAVRCTGGVRFYTGWNPNIGVSLLPGDSTWNSISDRNAKDNFTSVNGRSTLECLASIPIETWNYKTQESSIRHIGPMAQDFYAAFGLGLDDKHISTVDADGVALSAIQGLYEIVKEKDEKITSQQQQINSLEVRLAALEKLVSESNTISKFKSDIK